MTKGRPKPRVVQLLEKRGHYVVYALVAPDGLYLSQEDGDMVKLRRQSYEEIWRQPSDSYSARTPLGDGVLLGGGRKVRSARLDEKGHTVWKVNTFCDPFWDRNQLMAWGWTEECPRLLACLDANSGSILREWKLPNELLWAICVPGPRPRVVGTDGVSVGSFDLDLKEMIWQRQYGTDLVGQLANERVGEVISLPGKSSALVSVPVGFVPIQIVPFDEETVLLHARALFRCSLVDGSVLWRHSLRAPSPSAKVYRSGGRILMLQSDVLLGLDEATGEEVLRRQYDSERDSLPTFRDTFGVWYQNRLAVPFESGTLAIFDTNDGRIVSLHRERHSLWRALEVDGDLVLCTGAGKALIYGPEIWQL